jgi:hypothetical protein
MKARGLIGSATFDPQTLTTAFRVFDDAWEHIAPQVSARPEAIEAARMMLAEIVLGLMRNGGAKDATTLTQVAVQLTLAGPKRNSPLSSVSAERPRGGPQAGTLER